MSSTVKEPLPADLKVALVWVLNYLDAVYDQVDKPDLLPVLAQSAKAQAESIVAWLTELNGRFVGVMDVVKANRRQVRGPT